MGACHSRGGGGGGASTEPSSTFSQELRSYEADLQSDPALRSFDDVLRRRTGGAIAALAKAGETELLSFYALEEVVVCLLETNKEAFAVILESKSDVWKNPELKSLVVEYFNNTLLTLDLCAALDKSLNQASQSQIAVQAAVDRFEEDSGAAADVQGRFQKTLEYLAEFAAGENPFEEFFALFETLKIKQIAMLVALEKQRKKLGKKMKSIKAWRKISCVIFASAITALLICGVVTAAIAAPAVAAAVAAASSSASLGVVGKWADSLWKKRQENLEKQEDLAKAMKMGTFMAVHDLENVRFLVEALASKIRSMITAAEFAIREEEALRIAVDDIRKNLDAFAEGAENLRYHVEKCTQDVSRARALVLQKIINHPG